MTCVVDKLSHFILIFIHHILYFIHLIQGCNPPPHDLQYMHSSLSPRVSLSHERLLSHSRTCSLSPLSRACSLSSLACSFSRLLSLSSLACSLARLLILSSLSRRACPLSPAILMLGTPTNSYFILHTTIYSYVYLSLPPE